VHSTYLCLSNGFLDREQPVRYEHIDKRRSLRVTALERSPLYRLQGDDAL
jgi:hypothetical protein